MSGRTVEGAPRPQATADKGATGIRTDIQGLRALAVSLVLVFHLWPALLPGGYIGVDVFFVLSGFLITAHLLKEVDRSGTVSLARFWARRARRLLPAALTVLALTFVAVLLFVPAGLVAPFIRQVMASGLYIQNWVLAAESIDYMAAEAAPSPVQHYWSLSAEEQFYLAWPLLVLAAVALAAWLSGRTRGARQISRRMVLAIVLGVVVLASLVWSIVYTAREPAQAYFVTTTRAWEFGLGGLLALAATAPAGSWLGRTAARFGPGSRTVIVWAGLAAIVVCSLVYTGETAFPGWAAALPVAGAIAVMAARDPEHRFGAGRMLGLRPVQWLGDVSYAVYLWHWPIIVLAPYAIGRGMSDLDRIVILLVTFLLAALTKRFIEDPVRRGVPSTWRPSAVLAATAAAMAVVTVGSLAGVATGEERVAHEHQRIEQIVAEQPECLGAASLAPRSGCDAYATVLEAVLPDPALAGDPPERCITGTRAAELKVCDYGAPSETAVRTIALVGDSHAEQWMPALASIAEQHDWRLYVLAKSSCPFSGAERFEADMSPEALQEMNDSCNAWNDDAMAFIAEHTEIDTVLTSTRSTNEVRSDGHDEWRDAAAQAYHDRWDELPAHVDHIVALRDTPLMSKSTLACVSEHGTEAAAACAVDEHEAIARDPMVEAAATSDDPRVASIDLTEYFCADGVCPPVVGGVLAFRDTHHISWVYAETLAPYMDERLVSLIGARPAVPA